jgi:transcriptional regulator with XRE-family HTH domain
MPKSAKAIPNLRLKEVRELHGWSQKYVADQIGADNYYLSRWEHGTASPSPYYRRKLCLLFGMNAKELGHPLPRCSRTLCTGGDLFEASKRCLCFVT